MGCCGSGQPQIAAASPGAAERDEAGGEVGRQENVPGAGRIDLSIGRNRRISPPRDRSVVADREPPAPALTLRDEEGGPGMEQV